uniref:Uncharacterized protein n=1 Tax=Anopheles melas TaxID=34690 RepID=A0A182U711_9DIPT
MVDCGAPSSYASFTQTSSSNRTATQALALTRSKSPKKDGSMPVSPSQPAERDAEMTSPKAIAGSAVASSASSSSSSNSSSNSCSAEPPTTASDRIQPPEVNGASNHHLPTASNGGSSSTTNPPSTSGPPRSELGTSLHPAISVSQSLLAAAATVNRSGTPRISVSSSLTAPENNGPGQTGPSGRDSHPPNGPPPTHVDRTILQSPVAAVAAAAAAMQDRKQEFDFSKVNACSIRTHNFIPINSRSFRRLSVIIIIVIISMFGSNTPFVRILNPEKRRPICDRQIKNA